jgi:hypothetical protein
MWGPEPRTFGNCRVNVYLLTDECFGRIVLTVIYPVNNAKAVFYNYYVLRDDKAENKP